ncbi:Hypothetical protein CINCED_3A025533 [Cinara cedri]|uniref:Uncharacterized protein n=1 Tax=Cinara cedri TaxID=506608 RepID=A0A5E4MCH2_9HEMI|nr:Hypothetical protein CINCED_3A025533 [Cinara cedri]
MRADASLSRGLLVRRFYSSGFQTDGTDRIFKIVRATSKPVGSLIPVESNTSNVEHTDCVAVVNVINFKSLRLGASGHLRSLVHVETYSEVTLDLLCKIT